MRGPPSDSRYINYWVFLCTGHPQLLALDGLASLDLELNPAKVTCAPDSGH